jgi:hypothetical protein
VLLTRYCIACNNTNYILHTDLDQIVTGTDASTAGPVDRLQCSQKRDTVDIYTVPTVYRNVILIQ